MRFEFIEDIKYFYDGELHDEPPSWEYDSEEDEDEDEVVDDIFRILCAFLGVSPNTSVSKSYRLRELRHLLELLDAAVCGIIFRRYVRFVKRYRCKDAVHKVGYLATRRIGKVTAHVNEFPFNLLNPGFCLQDGTELVVYFDIHVNRELRVENSVIDLPRGMIDACLSFYFPWRNKNSPPKLVDSVYIHEGGESSTGQKSVFSILLPVTWQSVTVKRKVWIDLCREVIERAREDASLFTRI